MSITKRLSVKAAKPQDQTCASKVQKLTEAILADQTTALSNSVDQAVMDSVVYGFGTAVVKAEGMPVGGYTVSSNNVNPLQTPRQLPRITLELLETHPVFQLTREQLRAAWTIQYGRRWVRIANINSDDDLFMLDRLLAMGEMEKYHVTGFDGYARIVE